ncbi:unnamed protein product [Mytilus coruscus]|uniref:Uncharacterized protein n=1 Tax=Mytilus coruscus TaxID=42192 RepID=A0A6J8AGL4_MYTCO|nr:unnamed protein product [Mytilus coruscus]
MIPYFTFVLLFVCGEAKDHCPVIPSLHIDAALKIWNYLRINDQPVKGDIIIALGSHDVRVAERAAELWHDRYAEYILFSGKSGNLTRGQKCKICVTSPNINLLDYPNKELGDLADVITTVLGDMQRMGFYAKSGYQTFQRIADDVWSAFSILRRSGMYNGHLV